MNHSLQASKGIFDAERIAKGGSKGGVMILVLKNNNFLKFEGDIKNLPSDVAGCPAIEYEHTGGGKYYFKRHLNFKEWTLDYSGSLQDCRQEVRNFLHPEEILEIVRSFNSWLEYDDSQHKKEIERILSEKESFRRECLVLEKELRDVKLKLNDLYSVVKIIHDVNENGGTGSRKRVRELITPYITVCDYCKKADCSCNE